RRHTRCLSDWSSDVCSSDLLPTDGTQVPDYLVAKGASVPDLQVCYGLACDGTAGRVARFEARAEEAIPLTELAAGCLDIANAERSEERRVGEVGSTRCQTEC